VNGGVHVAVYICIVMLNLEVRRNSYASKSVWIVVQKCSLSLEEVKHGTAYPFRVNIDGEKSMG